jgi:hypothetical protein
VLSSPNYFDGGGAALLAQTSTPVGPIISDANNVYWTVQAANGGIFAWNKTMLGSNTPITIFAPENMAASNAAIPHEITISSGFIFWTNGNGDVRGAPLAANTTPVTIATGQNEPRGIAVDANYVFWTSMGDNKVRRISRPANLK